MLPIKKVYIDTKYKTKDSISNSNFKYELPQTMFMPENTVFYVDDVAIPHSWATVESFNDKLYFRVIGQAVNPTDHIISLEKQLYNGQTLATELTAKINALGYTSTVIYNASKQQISISITTYSFKFLTDNELQTIDTLDPAYQWQGTAYDKNNLQSANDLIKHNYTTSSTYSSASPFVTYIDLQPIRNIYISSPNIGNFNTIGARGESSIIKKVPVTANFNEMIFDSTLVGNDYLDCSRQTLRTLEFRLTDVSGNEIPLHGSNWSMSLIFDQMNKNS